MLRIDGVRQGELEKKFIEEAAAKGLMNLKGHRSLGGKLRAIFFGTSESLSKSIIFQCLLGPRAGLLFCSQALKDTVLFR